MDKLIWGAMATLCFLLGAFVVYLTLTNPEMPIRGFAISGVLVVVGAATLTRLKGPRAPS